LVTDMKKSSMYAIVAVVIIIIIVAGVAAWYYTSNPSTPSATPTPTSSAPAAGVADASTLTFDVNVTTNGQTTTYTWSAENTPDFATGSALKLRVDFAGYSYIFDTSASPPAAYSSTDGTTFTATDFASLWGTEAAPGFGNMWTDYYDALSTHWDGSSATYTFTDHAGAENVIFNISVNPSLPASTFATS
jgi:outer membrane lipoprotein-sorting protein